MVKEAEKIVEEMRPTPEEFMRDYAALCQRMGYRINIVPVWFQQDNGRFSLEIQTRVEELPKG